MSAADLRTPCTEEVAVFQAFARTAAEASDRIDVLDTAPTGHTLLLPDAAQSYRREIRRTAATVTPAVRDLAGRATAERPHLAAVDERSTARTWPVSWQAEPPIGPCALRALAGSVRATR